MRALLILGLMALAGCAGTTDESAPAGLPERTLDWTLTDCRFGVAIVSAPAGPIQERLPEGFRSLSLHEIGVPGAPAGSDANLGLELFVCAEGSGLDGPVPDLAYGSYFTAVEPPEDLFDPNVTIHFVKWDVVIPDEARRNLLQAYGVPAVDAAVEFTTAMSQGSISNHAGTLAIGDAVHSFEGSAIVPYDDGSFVEFMQTPGGLAQWRTSYVWSSGGVGPQTVQPAAGTWPAEILGTDAQNGVGFSGVASFVGGKIVLPAQPAP